MVRHPGGEWITGQVVGYVLTGEGLPTVYVSGEDASLDAVQQIADWFPAVDATHAVRAVETEPMVRPSPLLWLSRLCQGSVVPAGPGRRSAG